MRHHPISVFNAEPRPANTGTASAIASARTETCDASDRATPSIAAWAVELPKQAMRRKTTNLPTRRRRDLGGAGWALGATSAKLLLVMLFYISLPQSWVQNEK